VGAFDQNIFTQWHSRYGGRGVLIYWHVERKSMAIHSQLLTCTASEVAAMVEGAMHHGTTMTVEGNYVDSHSPRSASASPACSGSTCCPGSSGSTRCGCTGPPPANPTPTRALGRR
jgi:TnpA family transposase